MGTHVRKHELLVAALAAPVALLATRLVAVVLARLARLFVGVFRPLLVDRLREFGSAAVFEPVVARVQTTSPSEAAVRRTAVSQTGISLVVLLAGVLVVPGVVYLWFGEWPPIFTHKLRFGRAGRDCLDLIVHVTLLLELCENFFLVVVEQVFTKAVGFEEADTAVLRPRFELEQARLVQD